MEKKILLLKALKTIFVLIFLFATIYLVRTSINYFRDKNIFENSKNINFKFLKSKNKSHGGANELIIKNIGENKIDTLNIEKLITDSKKRDEILAKSKDSLGIEMVVVEQVDGEIVIDNKKYSSYTKTEFEAVKEKKQTSYMQAFLLTIGIMLSTFIGTAFANKASKKKSRNRRSKISKKR